MSLKRVGGPASTRANTTGGTVDVASLTFRSETPAVGDVAEARHRVLEWARNVGRPPHTAEVVVLAASELVTSAIRHARTPFELSIEFEDEMIEHSHSANRDHWGQQGHRPTIGRSGPPHDRRCPVVAVRSR